MQEQYSRKGTFLLGNEHVAQYPAVSGKVEYYLPCHIFPPVLLIDHYS